jgi:hypothetical protein
MQIELSIYSKVELSHNVFGTRNHTGLVATSVELQAVQIIWCIRSATFRDRDEDQSKKFIRLLIDIVMSPFLRKKYSILMIKSSACTHCSHNPFRHSHLHLKRRFVTDSGAVKRVVNGNSSPVALP